MSKIIFSLLIHEQPIVVLDQIINILKLNPDSKIVLHCNLNFIDANDFSLESLMSLVANDERIIVNKNRLKVGWGNIIQAHISNFEFVSSYDFDYFYFISSNELFLKKNVSDFISNYDFGCECKSSNNWHYYESMLNDLQFMNYLKMKNYSIYYSQIEGSFYSKKIMKKIVDEINSFFKSDNNSFFYPREEVFYSTIACNMFNDMRRYNGVLCKIRWEGKILFTSISSAKKICYGSFRFYSVKRVDRHIDNYLRYYIRHYLLRYDDDFLKVYEYKFKKYSLCKIKIIDFFYRFIYFIRDKIAKFYRFVLRKK